MSSPLSIPAARAIIAGVTDADLSAFAKPSWLAGVAAVPLDEMAIMVAEDPSVMATLIGALRHERATVATLRAALVEACDEFEWLSREFEHQMKDRFVEANASLVAGWRALAAGGAG